LAYQNRAVCHINHGDWDSAITDATDAIQRAPTEAVPWSVRARAYSGKRMFAKADSDIQTALARASSKPDKVQIFNEQGNIRFSANEYAKAIESYKKAIDLDPEFAKAWANMALAQRALGQTEEGAKSLDKALILDVNLSRGFTNKARFDVARNDKQAAVRNLDQAIKLDPND
jgi:tetratricopeptide (TPR) repeat protein